MSSFIVIICYNGRKFKGPTGLTFEGERRGIQIKRGTSYDTLKKKISDKLQLQANQIVSCLTCRFLVSGDQYTGVEIADDDDVELMIIALQQQPRMRVLELYVEINSVGRSLLPIRSLDINIQPFSSNDERYGSSSEAAPIHRPNTSREENDDTWNIDSNEDGEDEGEGQIPYGNSSNSDMEDDFDVDLVPHAYPTALNIASPVASFGLVSEHPHQVEGQTHTPFWNESPHYTYINWDHPDQERDILDGDVEGSWQIGDELFVKQEFEDKQAVQMAIKYHCMKVHQTAFVAESNRNLLYMKCQNYANGCPWRVRAMLPKYGNRWIITRWGGRHTCVNPYRSQDHKQLDSNFICSCILGMIKQEPSFSISLIQEKISRDFGFKISYRKAWKAKQKAIVKIFGDWDESYAILPRWLDYMQSFAQGSMYKIETKDFEVGNQVDTRFQVFHRLFWTFKQCCDAFKYCKPIIQVDGTFLYGKYRGTLLIATTQDGNCCVLPIAFAIVEGETLEAWTWFLANIHQHVTQKQGICFISNQHQSIESAVGNEHLGWQPPHAYHVYCIRHIANNFDNKFKNMKLKNDLFKLGYMTSKIYFDRNLEKFRQTSPEIASWIDDISKEKWSIAYDDEGRRYGHMTTNLPETINKILKGARNLPITSLVKCTYSRLVEYFVQKGSQARAEFSAGNRFCKKLLDAIQKNQEEACSLKVRTHDVILNMFEVEETFNPVTQTGSRLVSVDLCKRTCQCGKFTAYRFPCSHVIAACAHADIDFYQYVDPIYSIENIVDTYSAQWSPIGNEESIPPASGPRLVPNVETVRAKGRPKSTRIRNEMDLVESHPRHNKCGYCKQVGHSRRTCPAHPDH